MSGDAGMLDARAAVPRSARSMLLLPVDAAQSDGPFWAIFDAAWYRRTYPSSREGQEEAPTDAALLAWHLEHGQQRGRAPNRLFDEAAMLRAHPDVRAALQAGSVESGFDAYCRDNGRQRTPHWLFDETYYLRRYADLSDAALDAHGLANGYDHFLRHGSREGRQGSRFFDPAIYRAALPPADAECVARNGGFADYLDRLNAGSAGVLATSIYFDAAWYVDRYEEVRAALADGSALSPLHHYLTNDTPLQFDPLPMFSEQFYLKRHPDVLAAVEAGDFRNGYQHFLTNGVLELRPPCERIDLKFYSATHRAVREDLDSGRAPDAFAHYLSVGRAGGLHTLPPEDEPVGENQAKVLFRRRAETLVPALARRPLNFAFDGTPALGVIVVMHNRFALTLQALASLRAGFHGAIELILVDSGSTDETRHIERCVVGATVLRFDTNVGFVRGANAGLAGLTAEFALYLNNDVELARGALQAALDRLAADPTIGAVGGKVIRTHGVLQEAGCIVWRDGTTLGYLRDAAPDAPEANFVRDVDFCSAVFLMVRAALLHTLEGFAEAFVPAYYEDADLCLRIAAAGLRIVYDPSVVVHHLEYGSSTGALAAQAAIARARAIFVARNTTALQARRDDDPAAQVFARHAIGNDPGQRRVLFIEDTIPLRLIGSGFVRSNDLVALMAAQGFAVTVFPINPGSFDLATIHADMPDTVEVMRHATIDDLGEFLRARAGYYDILWVARTHNLDRIRPILESVAADTGSLPRIVLDTEAIAALRVATEAEVRDNAGKFDLDRAVVAEFANASLCQGIVAVSDAEAAKLRALGFSDVSVIGHQRVLRPTPRRFAERLGLLFVGAIHEIDSPNHDSLCWFVEAVLPLVEQELGWETRLTIAGYTAPGVSLDRFRAHPRITLRGTVPDLTPLYDSHRLIVASSLLCEQTGWHDGEDMLAAPVTDPAAFARRIVGLYRDGAAWTRIRETGLARLARENSNERYQAALRGVIG
jgi:GT2 family glycosyltransferase